MLVYWQMDLERAGVDEVISVRRLTFFYIKRRHF